MKRHLLSLLAWMSFVLAIAFWFVEAETRMWLAFLVISLALGVVGTRLNEMQARMDKLDGSPGG